jgi:hypothetical protein
MSSMSFENLFNRWKSKYQFNAFIKDGIVDFEQYRDSVRVLFVLRDMNCNSERDLCADLRENGSGWKTWNNVARWTKALLDGDKTYDTNMSRDQRIEQLKRIAVLNLKKEGGGNRTNGAELLDVVKTQKDFIYEELSLCDPDVIVCCGLTSSGIIGNATLLKNEVLPFSSEWKSFRSKTFDREWWYYFTSINQKQVPVVSFCHPQVTVLEGFRGHEKLFRPLYLDMLYIREMFINGFCYE